MWSTVMEFRRPANFDVVRQKLLGAAVDGVSVEFGSHGDITVGFTSSASTAAEATTDSLRRLAYLLLEARLTLEPHSVRTCPSGYPVLPRLAGAKEIADILGVTKSRVSQLTRSAGFPAPVAKLAMGPVYLESAVREYGRLREEAVQRREVTRLLHARAGLHET